MTGYEKDIQKEYNKKYYEANKLKIAEQIGKKEKCENCCKNKRHMELHPKEEILGGNVKKEEEGDSDSNSDSDSDSDGDSDEEVELVPQNNTCASKSKEYVCERIQSKVLSKS